MKRFLLAVLLFSHHTVSAQKEEVILDTADSKAALFSKSMAWVAKTWKSANDVIQLKDEPGGTIIVKGGLSAKYKQLGVVTDGNTMIVLTIRVKNGKAKLEFSDTELDYRGHTSV